jgi:hypothetical protein
MGDDEEKPAPDREQEGDLQHGWRAAPARRRQVDGNEAKAS